MRSLITTFDVNRVQLNVLGILQNLKCKIFERGILFRLLYRSVANWRMIQSSETGIFQTTKRLKREFATVAQDEFRRMQILGWLSTWSDLKNQFLENFVWAVLSGHFTSKFRLKINPLERATVVLRADSAVRIERENVSFRKLHDDFRSGWKLSRSDAFPARKERGRRRDGYREILSRYFDWVSLLRFPGNF